MRAARVYGQGFSLIELLMVIGIISILASLLLTAISRVYSKAKAMEYDFNGMMSQLDDRLSNFYGGLKSYKAIPAEDLHQLGVIDRQTMKLIRSGRAQFFPFSSTDPDRKIIFRLKWTGEFNASLRKADVMDKPKKDASK